MNTTDRDPLDCCVEALRVLAEKGGSSDAERHEAQKAVLSQTSFALFASFDELAEGRAPASPRATSPLDREFVIRCLEFWDHPAVQHRLYETVRAGLQAVVAERRSERNRGREFSRREFQVVDFGDGDARLVLGGLEAETSPDVNIRIAPARESILLPLCPASLVRGESMLDLPVGAVIVASDDLELEVLGDAVLEENANP